MTQDMYQNFKELSENETKEQDYQIELNKRDSNFLIIAIHGGKIESGTTEIAKHIAADDLSYYSFLGIKDKGNFENLHITSTNFDEPQCLALVDSTDKVVSIHGKRGDNDEFIMVGGLDRELGNSIRDSLKNNGFNLSDPVDGVRGLNSNNICNLCNSRKGVQLEISRKLRNKLEVKDELMDKFVNAVRSVLV